MSRRHVTKLVVAALLAQLFVFTDVAGALTPPGPPQSNPAVVRGNTWYLRRELPAVVVDQRFVYGDPGDVPGMGDWDGNGTDTPGVVRNGVWHLRNSNSTGIGEISFAYGNPGDFPVVGDWDGNGTDTPGVVRGPSIEGYEWFLRNSNSTGTGIFPGFTVLAAGTTFLAGDWDGDRIASAGVFDDRTAGWAMRNAHTIGYPDMTFTYGNPGDRALSWK